jgi:hypothetical protein
MVRRILESYITGAVFRRSRSGSLRPSAFSSPCRDRAFNQSILYLRLIENLRRIWL